MTRKVDFSRMERPGTASSRPAANIIYDQDFIVIYQSLARPLCEAIIARFDADDRKWQGKIGSAGKESHQDDTKISWDLDIPHDGSWKDLFQQLHPAIEVCMADYLSRSPILQSFELQVTGYKVQMYPRNRGRFLWHADSVGRHGGDRVVAMVLYLNDVAKGGETEFFHQGVQISPKAGCLMLFPAAWNYMHCGHMPESSDKYIISSFIKVKT